MPTRLIKESCRTSANLQRVQDFSERLFWRLLTTADDYGRCLASPAIVRANCFPLADNIALKKIEGALSDLASHHLLSLYTIGDRSYAHFITFELHQGKPRAKHSKYPSLNDVSASICTHMQVVPDMPASAPDTDTDTDTDLSSSSKKPLKSLSSLIPIPRNNPDLKSKNHVSKSSAVWSAYAGGFLSRYGVEPVRNAKTNSQLGKLVDRLGEVEAPGVAAFYCTHDSLLYVRSKHCVDLLLRDAEGLRMEWATGRQVTNGQAQLTDRTSTTGSIVKKLIAEEEAKHVDRRA